MSFMLVVPWVSPLGWRRVTAQFKAGSLVTGGGGDFLVHGGATGEPKKSDPLFADYSPRGVIQVPMNAAQQVARRSGLV